MSIMRLNDEEMITIIQALSLEPDYTFYVAHKADRKCETSSEYIRGKSIAALQNRFEKKIMKLWKI